MATRSFMGRDREKLLECPVCLNPMNTRIPRALPCLHTFCESCLTECAKQCMRGSITCPTCRVSSNLPDGGIKELPHNFILNQVIDTFKKDQECENCIETCETPVAATDFCRQCQKSFCAECSAIHDSISLFKNHQVVKLSGGKQHENISMCALHAIPLDIYCFECDECICSSCALKVEHRGHHDSFKDIEEEIETYCKTASEIFMPLIPYCDIHKEKVETAILHLKGIDKAIYDEGEKRKKNIDLKVQTLRQHLNDEYIRPAELCFSELMELGNRVRMLQMHVDGSDSTALRLSELKLHTTACKEFSEKVKALFEEAPLTPKFDVSSSVPEVGTISSILEETAGAKTTGKTICQLPEMNYPNSGAKHAVLMVPGTRVRRGPDWIYSDQDGTPPGDGSVLSNTGGVFEVLWDTGCDYRYRMGSEGKYELQMAVKPTFQENEDLKMPCAEQAKCMVRGSRVRRGQDWIYTNQDGTPPGNGSVLSNAGGIVEVLWDTGNICRYRMGNASIYELQMALHQTNERSRDMKIPAAEQAKLMSRGTRVRRGPDWSYTNQDGTPPGVGSVLSNSGGVVEVLWDTGNTFHYRMGSQGKYELLMVAEPRNKEGEDVKMTCVEQAKRMVRGSRVRRGQDWIYTNQDGTPPGDGSVLSNSGGVAEVLWDTGNTYHYRMGSQGKYELQMAEFSEPKNNKDA